VDCHISHGQIDETPHHDEFTLQTNVG